MTQIPDMKNFRVEPVGNGILHLAFDMPDRGMNVFTNEAIHEVEAFAEWLKTSDVAGVVIYSGKQTAFCAGADLTELSSAYDMIMAAPEAERDDLTVAHFSPIGRGFRKLETAGKPVAVAIAGLALGGGCELALACHYRVMTDDPGTQIGLPESLVGLLPGGGGTQRLPRLTGVAGSLGVLLKGERFGAKEAVAAGAAHEAVPPGQEIAAAEAWILSGPDAKQPWDREDWTDPTREDVLAVTGPVRENVLKKTGGHFPAELAILDCLDNGLPVPMDHGIAAEVEAFKHLVQRIEPRNMIAVRFLGRVDYDKARRKESLPEGLVSFGEDVKAAMQGKAADLGDAGTAALVFAGIGADYTGDALSAQIIADRKPQWFVQPQGAIEKAALEIVRAGAVVACDKGQRFDAKHRNLIDYHCQQAAGYPIYLGGPFTFLELYGV